MSSVSLMRTSPNLGLSFSSQVIDPQLKNVVSGRHEVDFVRGATLTEGRILGDGGDCGFRATDSDREIVVSYLLSEQNNPQVRQMIAPEIRGWLVAEMDGDGSDILVFDEAITRAQNPIYDRCQSVCHCSRSDALNAINDFFNSAPDADWNVYRATLSPSFARFEIQPEELAAVRAAMGAKENYLKVQSEKPEVFRRYIENYYLRNRGYLLIPDKIMGHTQTGVMDIIAEMQQAEIRIWKVDPYFANTVYLHMSIKPSHCTHPPFDLIHRGLHFNKLIREPGFQFAGNQMKFSPLKDYRFIEDQKAIPKASQPEKKSQEIPANIPESKIDLPIVSTQPEIIDVGARLEIAKQQDALGLPDGVKAQFRYKELFFSLQQDDSLVVSGILDSNHLSPALQPTLLFSKSCGKVIFDNVKIKGHLDLGDAPMHMSWAPWNPAIIFRGDNEVASITSSRHTTIKIEHNSELVSNSLDLRCYILVSGKLKTPELSLLKLSGRLNIDHTGLCLLKGDILNQGAIEVAAGGEFTSKIGIFTHHHSHGSLNYENKEDINIEHFKAQGGTIVGPKSNFNDNRAERDVFGLFAPLLYLWIQPSWTLTEYFTSVVRRELKAHPHYLRNIVLGQALLSNLHDTLGKYLRFEQLIQNHLFEYRDRAEELFYPLHSEIEGMICRGEVIDIDRLMASSEGPVELCTSLGRGDVQAAFRYSGLLCTVGNCQATLSGTLKKPPFEEFTRFIMPHCSRGIILEDLKIAGKITLNAPSVKVLGTCYIDDLDIKNSKGPDSSLVIEPGAALAVNSLNGRYASSDLHEIRSALSVNVKGKFQVLQNAVFDKTLEVETGGECQLRGHIINNAKVKVAPGGVLNSKHGVFSHEKEGILTLDENISIEMLEGQGGQVISASAALPEEKEGFVGSKLIGSGADRHLMMYGDFNFNEESFNKLLEESHASKVYIEGKLTLSTNQPDFTETLSRLQSFHFTKGIHITVPEFRVDGDVVLASALHIDQPNCEVTINGSLEAKAHHWNVKSLKLGLSNDQMGSLSSRSGIQIIAQADIHSEYGSILAANGDFMIDSKDGKVFVGARRIVQTPLEKSYNFPFGSGTDALRWLKPIPGVSWKIIDPMDMRFWRLETFQSCGCEIQSSGSRSGKYDQSLANGAGFFSTGLTSVSAKTAIIVDHGVIKGKHFALKTDNEICLISGNVEGESSGFLDGVNVNISRSKPYIVDLDYPCTHQQRPRHPYQYMEIESGEPSMVAVLEGDLILGSRIQKCEVEGSELCATGNILYKGTPAQRSFFDLKCRRLERCSVHLDTWRGKYSCNAAHSVTPARVTAGKTVFWDDDGLLLSLKGSSVTGGSIVLNAAKMVAKGELPPAMRSKLAQALKNASLDNIEIDLGKFIKRLLDNKELIRRESDGVIDMRFSLLLQDESEEDEGVMQRTLVPSARGAALDPHRSLGSMITAEALSRVIVRAFVEQLGQLNIGGLSGKPLLRSLYRATAEEEARQESRQRLLEGKREGQELEELEQKRELTPVSEADIDRAEQAFLAFVSTASMEAGKAALEGLSLIVPNHTLQIQDAPNYSQFAMLGATEGQLEIHAQTADLNEMVVVGRRGVMIDAARGIDISRSIMKASEGPIQLHAEQGDVKVQSSALMGNGVLIGGQYVTVELLKEIRVYSSGDTTVYQELPDGVALVDAGEGDYIVIADKKYVEKGVLSRGENRRIHAAEGSDIGGVTMTTQITTVSTSKKGGGLFGRSKTTTTTSTHISQTHYPSISDFVNEIEYISPGERVALTGTIQRAGQRIRFEGGVLSIEAAHTTTSSSVTTQSSGGLFRISRTRGEGSSVTRAHPTVLESRVIEYISKDISLRGVVLNAEEIHLLTGAMMLITAAEEHFSAFSYESKRVGFKGSSAKASEAIAGNHWVGSHVEAERLVFVDEEGKAVDNPQTLTTIRLESSVLKIHTVKDAYLNILQCALKEYLHTSSSSSSFRSKGFSAPALSLPHFEGDSRQIAMESFNHVRQYTGHIKSAVKLGSQLQAGDWQGAAITVLSQFTNVSFAHKKTSMERDVTKSVPSKLEIDDFQDSHMEHLHVEGSATIKHAKNVRIDRVTVEPLVSTSRMTMKEDIRSLTINPLKHSIGLDSSHFKMVEERLSQEHSQLVIDHADNLEIDEMDLRGLDLRIGGEHDSNVMINKLKAEGTVQVYDLKTSSSGGNVSISFGDWTDNWLSPREGGSHKRIESVRRSLLRFNNVYGRINHLWTKSADLVAVGGDLQIGSRENLEFAVNSIEDSWKSVVSELFSDLDLVRSGLLAIKGINDVHNLLQAPASPPVPKDVEKDEVEKSKPSKKQEVAKVKRQDNDEDDHYIPSDLSISRQEDELELLSDMINHPLRERNTIDLFPVERNVSTREATEELSLTRILDMQRRERMLAAHIEVRLLSVPLRLIGAAVTETARAVLPDSWKPLIKARAKEVAQWIYRQSPGLFNRIAMELEAGARAISNETGLPIEAGRACVADIIGLASAPVVGAIAGATIRQLKKAVSPMVKPLVKPLKASAAQIRKRIDIWQEIILAYRVSRPMPITALLDRYITCQYNTAFTFYDSLLSELKLYRYAQASRGKQTVVYIMPKMRAGPSHLPYAHLNLMEFAAGKKLVVARVSNPRAITRILQRQDNISAVWIAAHGDFGCIDLGRGELFRLLASRLVEKLPIDKFTEITKLVLEKSGFSRLAASRLVRKLPIDKFTELTKLVLEKSGFSRLSASRLVRGWSVDNFTKRPKLILEICEAGKSLASGKPGFAEQVAKELKGRIRVFATTDLVNCMRMSIGRGRTVRFYDVIGKDVTVTYPAIKNVRNRTHKDPSAFQHFDQGLFVVADSKAYQKTRESIELIDITTPRNTCLTMLEGNAGETVRGVMNYKSSSNLNGDMVIWVGNMMTIGDKGPVPITGRMFTILKEYAEGKGIRNLYLGLEDSNPQLIEIVKRQTRLFTHIPENTPSSPIKEAHDGYVVFKVNNFNPKPTGVPVPVVLPGAAPLAIDQAPKILEQKLIPASWLGEDGAVAGLEKSSYSILEDHLGKQLFLNINGLYAESDYGTMRRILNKTLELVNEAGVNRTYLLIEFRDQRLYTLLERQYNLTLVEKRGVDGLYEFFVRPESLH